MDNLSVRGIESDAPRRHHSKSRGKQRKPFKIEYKLLPPSHPLSVFHQLGLSNWPVWGRYTTAARRNQAYAALVKRNRNHPWGMYWMYRKVDP